MDLDEIKRGLRAEIKNEQLAAARHNKLKRCLAMAKWCVEKYENYSLLANEAYQRGCNKSGARWDRLADKWLSRKSRWLERAEKFKPNNKE